ncbi:hypothetical protein H5410_050785 [Solanum commersonii]|uniref:Uncharacterized protein n=1 Tax=Solanum commersonii TaxID=4109 RepID=A0A9J5WYW1_SOLCO|nr:hypothetical protein H5410_050785 [Solanum commersonii]
MASGSGPPEHTLILNKTQAHLTQLLGLSSKPKTAMFTEPFSDFINSNWGEAKHPFKHSIMDWELGKHMQMEEGEPKTRNQRIEEAQAEDMTQEEDRIAFEGETNSYCMSGGDSSFLESFENQLVTYNESEPLSIEENLTEEMIETRATIWVHLNVIKLGINGAMSEFSKCIEEMELVDPPLFGGSYTWRRGENHRSASRIDRFLYSSLWEEQFTLIKQADLPKIGSDHNPIMLSCGELNFKKKYFKFESWWLRVEGFKEKVQQWWGAFVVKGRPDYILVEKLKMLKEKLKEWSRNNRGNWKQRKGDILNQIAALEAIQEQRALTDDEAMQKSNLVLEFEEVARNEKIAWRQRSRIQWLKQGDQNTSIG